MSNGRNANYDGAQQAHDQEHQQEDDLAGVKEHKDENLTRYFKKHDEAERKPFVVQTMNKNCWCTNLTLLPGLLNPLKTFLTTLVSTRESTEKDRPTLRTVLVFSRRRRLPFGGSIGV